jgi:hypothetical protein
VLKHVTASPDPPSSRIAGVDVRLEAICLRALNKSPEQRPQSAREMRGELRAVAEGQSGWPRVAGAAGAGAGEEAREHIAPTPPSLGHAATLQMSAAVAATLDESSGKPTLQGTATAVPGAAKPHRVVLATAAVAGVIGLVVAGVVLITVRTKPVPPPPAALSPAAPQTAIEALPVVPPSLPEVEPADIASNAGAAAAHAAPRPSHGPPPSLAVPGKPGTPPGASVASASVPVATLAPSAAEPPAVTPPASAPLAVPSAPDPSFDPSSGYVEVGLINAQGVRERAIRAALHGVPLAACYRAALRARGARVTGVAQLALSVDESGVARSAIATGADFLPGLARCIQGAAARLSVPASRVDSGGGTADVTLAFKTP